MKRTYNYHLIDILKKTLFFVFFCFSIGLQAQTITGKITSVEGDPLFGAFVLQKGTTNGTSTDFDGNYKLKLLDNQSKILVFSYLGYKNVEKAIGDLKTINVKLVEESQSLDEIVIVGYGEKKRQDVTGAISSIKAKDLEDQFYTNITETLQGQASGVLVTSDSGEPGAGISVNIRGINSLTGNSQPLYVLNGIPIGLDTQAPGDDFFTGTNPLASLNPDDIQSIEILKDASATAIYGARAANGVVLITTKEAKIGKVKITTNLRTSISDVGVPYNLMVGGQYAQFRNDIVGLLNPQLTFDELLATNRLFFDGSNEFRPLPENAADGTRFMDALFRKGINRNANVTISGGDENMSQLLSVSFNDIEGNIINSHFQRANLRYNSKMKIGEKFKLNSNIQLNYSRNQRVQTSARTGLSGVVFSAMRISPFVPLFDLETGEFNLIGIDGEIITNPLVEATESDNVQKDKRLIFSTEGTYSFNDNFKWTNRIGYNAGLNTNQVFNNKKTVVGANSSGRLFLSERESNRFTVESFLNFNKRFNKHKINATVGASYTDITSFAKRELYTDFTFDDLGLDALQLASTSQNFISIRTNNYFKSLLYRFNYTINDKYTLTTTGRYDGDSKFSQGEPWGFFPSAAISWDAHKEKFIRDIRAISLLKLRVSYGQVGSSRGVAPYSTLDTYNISNIGLTDNNLYTGTFPARIANKNLTWETSTTLNLGLNANFFRNRLRTSVDVYERITENLLNNQPIPRQNGFASVPINDGTLNNRGIEVDLAYDVFKEENFSWTTKLNLTRNVTKLVDYGALEFIDGRGLATNFFGINGTRTYPGEELGLFFGYKVTGLIQPSDLVDYAAGDFRIRTEEVTLEDGTVTQQQLFATTAPVGNGNPGANAPGTWKFEDIDGDGRITQADRQTIGNPNPDLFFGFNNQFRIGDFNISMFIQGSIGNDILNLNKAFIGSGWQGANGTQDYYNNRWTINNQHNDVRYPSFNGPTGVNVPNSVFIEDGSYVRLKNLSVRYNLKNLKAFSNVAIVLTGTNLVTITNYTGPDPEVSTNGGGALNRGIDYSAFPRPKVFTLGLNLTF
ncbi:TonB-dependent receptor [Polaribacter aestuariivivens]|uniref:TonB-dependent receptor n=1 Tax=Polaribacter aestuariivivens TaxID=2304626 RepID=A0A5S3N7U9_9FLAO|nr:TonB-dependent receptor [Polaribacter aestuariivivens]TMM30624.1 TonB-dependent receptor [Polaribacter aestuariivivens]